MKTEMGARMDVQIFDEVRDALRQESRVNQLLIGVIVRDGVVTLTGAAGSRKERAAAELVTQRAPGVKSVINEIEISVPRGSATPALRHRGDEAGETARHPEVEAEDTRKG
jgi:osmotically-inducible protein OsmY